MRSEDHARLAQRLALPQLALPRGEVAGELVQRDSQRTAPPRRPQTRIQFIQPSVRSQVIDHLDDPLSQLTEEVLVGGRLVIAVSAGMASRPVRLVQEHHVQVAVIIRLASAQFAHRQDDQLARLAVFRTALNHRRPVACCQALEFADRDLLQADFTDVRQHALRFPDVGFSQDVPHPDAQMQGVLEPVQDRLGVFGAAQQVLQHPLQGFERRQLVQQQRIQQFVDHPRVAGQDAR